MDLAPSFDFVRDIVREATGETVARIEPVPHGQCNTVYFVSPNRGDRVARFGRSGESLDGYYKEEWCLTATADLIPGPDVLAIGRTGEWAFMIETRIIGALASTRPELGIHVWRQLGECARRLADVPVEGHGFFLMERGRGVFRDSWTGIVEWYCDYLFDDDVVVRLGALSASQVDRAREIIADMGQWDFSPRLNHGNLALENAARAPGRGAVCPGRPRSGGADRHSTPLGSLKTESCGK
jgi:hypothetical protein